MRTFWKEKFAEFHKKNLKKFADFFFEGHWIALFFLYGLILTFIVKIRKYGKQLMLVQFELVRKCVC